jgi:hypothetical protein
MLQNGSVSNTLEFDKKKQIPVTSITFRWTIPLSAVHLTTYKDKYYLFVYNKMGLLYLYGWLVSSALDSLFSAVSLSLHASDSTRFMTASYEYENQ